MATDVSLALRPQGLQDSAQRYVRGLLASTSGYEAQQQQQASSGAPVQGSQGLEVLEPGMRFSSQCEHHVLPFYGQVHVAYALDQPGRALGRGEMEALVRRFSRRLQIQERFTHQMAEAVGEATGAIGTLVVCDAR